MSKKHMGSIIDDFLKEERIFEEAQAVKEVDRLLDPKNDITLSLLQRAAAMAGRSVSIELV